MTIICNVTGSERKRLAQALGEALLVEPVYTKAPTFAYVVDNYTIDKTGTISCPDSTTSETVAKIIDKLTGEGFVPKISGDDVPTAIQANTPDIAPKAEAEAMPETEATGADAGAKTPETAEKTAEVNPFTEKTSAEDETKLTVSIPRDKLPDEALARLRTMVSNKDVLFKRALLADALPIEVSEDQVSFPWFTLTGMTGEAEAYAQFITYLCKMATEQTRVLDRPYDGDNDRFAMRIFMVRLGMKGAQFALARKLMMKNLTGNSGWRYGTPSKKAEASIPDAPSDAVAVEEPEALPPEKESDTTAEDTDAGEG